MTRAFLFGLLVLAAVNAVWLLSLILRWPPEFGVLAGYFGPFVASAITAYSAPFRRDLLGMLIAVPAAASMIAVPMAYGAMGGHAESIGPTGVAVVSYWFLLKSLILCGIGSTLGRLLAKRRVSWAAWKEPM